jgi:hypothetical protein
VGTRAPDRGVSGARRGLRNEGVVQEGGRGERKKREGESCWKSGGGRVRLYTWRRTGLADEVRCDAIPDAAGGEGGHGAAKPHGVIHRYVYYLFEFVQNPPADCLVGFNKRLKRLVLYYGEDNMRHY